MKKVKLRGLPLFVSMGACIIPCVRVCVSLFLRVIGEMCTLA